MPAARAGARLWGRLARTRGRGRRPAGCTRHHRGSPALARVEGDPAPNLPRPALRCDGDPPRVHRRARRLAGGASAPCADAASGQTPSVGRCGARGEPSPDAEPARTPRTAPGRDHNGDRPASTPCSQRTGTSGARHSRSLRPRRLDNRAFTGDVVQGRAATTVVPAPGGLELLLQVPTIAVRADLRRPHPLVNSGRTAAGRRSWKHPHCPRPLADVSGRATAGKPGWTTSGEQTPDSLA